MEQQPKTYLGLVAFLKNMINFNGFQPLHIKFNKKRDFAHFQDLDFYCILLISIKVHGPKKPKILFFLKKKSY